MLRLFKRETRKILKAFFHPTFIYLTVIGNVFLLLGTFVVYRIEKGHNPNMKSYFDCFWWGVSTVTTIGYGDILPVTVAGRAVGILLMYTGTVMFISFTGILVSFMLREEVERELKVESRIEKILQGIEQRLERMEKKHGKE